MVRATSQFKEKKSNELPLQKEEFFEKKKTICNYRWKKILKSMF